ncbi:glycosyltransferase family 2 protein [Alicyclobacillus fastidiosus]|uniref:Glycosyltransferase family 2 protein n=1 Tax=Alicyclobacillus fastidiosus TaxID=392011 RepID=A0ABY6ZMN5_9BACL|nr:glycosyltransferase family 2 protein [Alicyclobacillus fastidiosus]WAH44203.1 glycosyltransferase family 2 protein [Alicyclobacillus fastidiosus]GMA60519.1 dolichol monophosphate mannose synthase [Alicyclobacillus fastidiosus]
MDLSIIIPSFNERENIEPIVERIHSALRDQGIAYEIWFVDDSTDETVSVLTRVESIDEQVHVHHRTGARGLASAVVEGFERATGEHFIVMDADLQHPPELLPDIYRKLAAGIDVVIPSRFVSGGSDGGLGPLRKLVSWTARVIGQVALRRLRKISDCTSGFFGVHRNVVVGAPLDPIGWKILIEVLVKGRYRTVHELPYEFLARDAGESKMSLQEQWNYFRHLFRLVSQSPSDRRFFLFCIIGASGVVVNLVVLTILKYAFGISDISASITASLVAMLSNYIWNDQITWRASGKRKWNVKLPLFVGISLIGIIVTTLVMNGLKHLDVPVPVGQAIGILVSTVWSYAMNNRLTWRDSAKQLREDVIVTREDRRIRSV